MTANEIIRSALRKLLVTAGGRVPTSTQYNEGLESLNDMINSWSAEDQLIYEDTREELSIPSATHSITIGATGTLVTARPMDITVATLKSGNNEYPLRLIDEGEFQHADKSASGLPYGLYYRDTYPDGTLYFNCTTDKAYTLVLTSLKELSTFADGTTEVSLPNHYNRALKANLTVEMADEMGAGNNVTQVMIKLAEESKNAIIGKAVSIVAARTDITGSSRYDISSDS